jgi:hypothetical protein
MIIFGELHIFRISEAGYKGKRLVIRHNNSGAALKFLLEGCLIMLTF